MKKQVLHTVVWKEDTLYIAKFLELELASQGKTRNEALDNLKVALELYFEDADSSTIQFPIIEEVTTDIVPFV